MLLTAGCEDRDRTISVWQASTVGSYIDTECSTAVVLPLSQQIAEEVDCLMPGQLVRFEEGAGLIFTGAAVVPYASPEARADLLAAAASGDIEINSAWRSVAQQYLLRKWFEAGRCGITAAAQPGESNHESGRAVDVNNWADRIGALEANGWAQTVPGDEVHFDHLASPDIRGSDVLAFQRLWNRNHPEDLIDEDGFWGAMTESRLAESPAEGFPIGATCVDDPGDPGPGDDSDPVPEPDDPSSVTGGCAVGGTSTPWFALLALLALRRRRRVTGTVAPAGTM